MAGGLAYIRKLYGVPARRGARVEYDGQRGVITGAINAHVRIRLDGETKSRIYHPTWKIKYLPEE